MVCGISSPCTGEDSLSVIRGSPKVQWLLSQVLHDGVTAWPWHNAHYLSAVFNTTSEVIFRVQARDILRKSKVSFGLLLSR